MCNCITKVNEFLKDHNTQVEFPIVFNANKGLSVVTAMRISTVKLDTKNREGPVALFASYCPICGEKYEDKEIEKK